MSGKRLELLLQSIAGNVRSVAIMMNPDNPVHAVFWGRRRGLLPNFWSPASAVEGAKHRARSRMRCNAVIQDRAAALIVFR